MVTCPVCNNRAVGKVGAGQYFCWECCVEFLMRGQNVKVYNVEPDGSLSIYDGPAQSATADYQLQEG